MQARMMWRSAENIYEDHYYHQASSTNGIRGSSFPSCCALPCLFTPLFFFSSRTSVSIVINAYASRHQIHVALSTTYVVTGFIIIFHTRTTSVSDCLPFANITSAEKSSKFSRSTEKPDFVSHQLMAANIFATQKSLSNRLYLNKNLSLSHIFSLNLIRQMMPIVSLSPSSEIKFPVHWEDFLSESQHNSNNEAR